MDGRIMKMSCSQNSMMNAFRLDRQNVMVSGIIWTLSDEKIHGVPGGKVLILYSTMTILFLFDVPIRRPAAEGVHSRPFSEYFKKE